MTHNRYIVVWGSSGCRMVEWRDTPSGGVLMIAGRSPATVFQTRRQAKRAVARSLGYADGMGYSWGPYRIIRFQIDA